MDALDHRWALSLFNDCSASFSYISVNWSLIFLPFFPRYLCAKHRSGNPLTLVANDMWNVEVDAEQSIYWFIIIIDIANAHDPTISINRSTSLIDDQRFSQLWIQIVHTQKSRWCEHQMKIYLLKFSNCITLRAHTNKWPMWKNYEPCILVCTKIWFLSWKPIKNRIVLTSSVQWLCNHTHTHVYLLLPLKIITHSVSLPRWKSLKMVILLWERQLHRTLERKKAMHAVGK